MRILKISTIIFFSLIFISLAESADKISCKKYAGNYLDYSIDVTFFNNGKMLISVNSSNSGYYLSPGSYILKNSEIQFYYKGLKRFVVLKGDKILASLYSFAIEDDLENKIILSEDKSFPGSCK